MADIYRNLKKPGEALDAQRSANQIFERLIQAEPQNEEYEGDYVMGLDRLGLLLKQNQEYTEAEKTLRQGIARAEQLITRSPRTRALPEHAGNHAEQPGHLLVRLG